jgi:membrane-associated phospholipid phosphatase
MWCTQKMQLLYRYLDLPMAGIPTGRSKTPCGIVDRLVKDRVHFNRMYCRRKNIMHHKILLSLLLIIICESTLFAQIPAVRDSVVRNRYNLSQFGNETWRFIKQPARWDGSDWLKIGLLGAGTLLLMQVDQPVRDAVLKDRRYYNSVPIEMGIMYGEIYTPVLLFGGFALHAWVTDDIRTKKIAFEIAQASLYAGGLNYLMKTAFGRSRPYMNKGPQSYRPFVGIFKLGDQSLPGGHNVLAFLLSTVFSRNVQPVWLKGIVYVPAAFTFVARVYRDHHWTSDDFLGAGVGYFVATWVVDQHEQEDSRIQMTSVFPLTMSIRLN